MLAKIVLGVVLFVVVSADSRYRPPPQNSYSRPRPHDSSEDSFERPNYNFNWNVNEDYNNFGQQESRDGDNTQGEYTVELPDGRRQTVKYHVDGESGFIADVTFSGEARFPEESRRPTYNTPRPSYQPPTTRAPSYQPPPPTTRRPSRPTTRRSSYNAPRPAANSLLSAFGYGK